MSNRWPIVEIRQILQLQRRWIVPEHERLYTEIGIRSFGRGVFLKTPVTGLSLGNKRVLRIEPHDLVFNNVFAWEGAVAVAQETERNTIGSHRFVTFTARDNACDLRFLQLFFRSVPGLEVLGRASPGSAGRNRTLGIDRFLSERVPLPPLDEQRRIVATIDRLASKIAEARKLRIAVMRDAEALGASHVNGLIEQLRAKARTVVLGEIAEIRSGVTLGRELNGPTIALPYLRVANVQDGRLDLSVMKTVHVFAEERNKWRLEPGDVLLTEGGDWDKLGRGTVWNGEIPDCIHQNHIFRVRLDQAKFDPRYVAALTSSPYGRAYFADASKQTTNLASVNQRQLKAFPIFAIDLTEQRQILARLAELQTKADTCREALTKSAAEIDALLPAVLSQVFNGYRVAESAPSVTDRPDAVTPTPLPLTAGKAAAGGRKHSPAIYFKRAAIAAYIIDRLHTRPTFGRVQLEKCLYLAEAYVGVDLEGEFKRAAAGPLDAEYLYKLESAAQKNGWFIKRTIAGDKTRHTYHPGAKSDQLLAAAEKYLGTGKAKMDFLLGWIEKFDTERAEIVATLFAAWSDLLRAGHAVTDDAIITEVRGNWHESKKRFEPTRLRIALGWMREHHLAPTQTDATIA